MMTTIQMLGVGVPTNVSEANLNMKRLIHLTNQSKNLRLEIPTDMVPMKQKTHSIDRLNQILCYLPTKNDKLVQMC